MAKHQKNMFHGAWYLPIYEVFGKAYRTRNKIPSVDSALKPNRKWLVIPVILHHYCMCGHILLVTLLM